MMSSDDTDTPAEENHKALLRWHQTQHMNACFKQIDAEAHEDLTGYCPTIWDGFMCWSRVLADTNYSQSCPDYVNGFNPNNSATKYCTTEATWFYSHEKNSTWTDYTQCYSAPNPRQTHINETVIQEWVPVIKKIAQVGYGISFITLLLAFFILVSIKKLRCPRNTLHMHLFVSFMMRAFITLLKDTLFREGIGPSSSFLESIEGGLSFNHDQANWECKLMTSLWQYFIVANYTWILMEGLYLHNLIFLAPFSDSSAITLYLLLGWGCPLLVVGSWVTARATLEDTLCWTTNLNKDVFLIIRIPIIISIVLNFLFFLNIVKVLLLKLQSAVSIETRKYRKWAKSTLVLVPLFGVHYMLFLWMSSYVDRDPVIEVVWLFCDQFFASFQGFFVSILYCLINGEVRSELGKKWNKWRSDTESKNVWVPLNQISSKFYHRSTHDDLMAHNGSGGQHERSSRSCCHNPCGGGSSRSSKNHQNYRPSREPGSPTNLTQTEDHHLTMNTDIGDCSPLGVAHDPSIHSSSSSANYRPSSNGASTTVAATNFYNIGTHEVTPNRERPRNFSMETHSSYCPNDSLVN